MVKLRTAQLNLDPNIIDLGIGQPSFDLLPKALLAEAAAHRFQQPDPDFLQYGLETGDEYFRLNLAHFLARAYGMTIELDQLFVTAGISQALDMICTVFTRPGDTIFIEEPSYFLALDIFADYDLNIISLPVDENGLIIAAVADKLAEVRPIFLYTIPTFHNPAAVTLPADRREALVRLSEEHDFLILADEVYHLLAYGTPPPPPLISFDRQGTVLSLGSFSKILAPGLRLGWVQADPKRLNALANSGQILSGGGLNPFASAIVNSLLELDLQTPYLDELKHYYRHNAAVLSEAIHRHMPQADFIEPTGGYFHWLRLPDNINTEALLPQSEKAGVSFKPGARFSSRAGLSNYLRLCFAFYGEEELTTGVQRLGWVLRL